MSRLKSTSEWFTAFLRQSIYNLIWNYDEYLLILSTINSSARILDRQSKFNVQIKKGLSQDA